MNPREDGGPHPLRQKDIRRVNTWKEFASKNKGKHILWNEMAMKKYILEKDPEYLPTFQSYQSWIIRCDAFRLFVLYHMGGVYTDIDTEVTDSTQLFNLIKTSDILIPGSDTRFKMSWIFVDFKYNNYFLASRQGEELFKSMYLNVRNVANVLKAGGPYYVSDMVSKELSKGTSNITIIPHNTIPVSHTSDKSWFKLQVDAYWKQYGTLVIFSIVVLACIIIAIVCYYLSKRNKGFYRVDGIYPMPGISLYSNWNGGLSGGREYW